LLSGHFAEGNGVTLPLTYLAASAVFWLALFAFALKHPLTSAAARTLVSLGPVLLFGMTVFVWIFLWSR
jgi:hypothetical protein